MIALYKAPGFFSRRQRLPLALCIVLALPLQPATTHAALPDHAESAPLLTFDQAALARLQQWQSLIEQAQELEDEAKLALVNQQLNQVRFVSDQEHWQKPDYWASPFEFLASNGGDCEDFSIAKYFTLVAAGIAEEQLRLMYVRASAPNQAHMVLAYYPSPSAEPLVLDNLIDEIRPASQRPDLTPVYSFNTSGLWSVRERAQQIGQASQIGPWTALSKRMLRYAGLPPLATLQLPFLEATDEDDHRERATGH